METVPAALPLTSLCTSPQGHAAPILYAVWAEAGFLPEAELLNLRKISSDLDGHPVPVSQPAGSLLGPCLISLFPSHKGEGKGGGADYDEEGKREVRGEPVRS